MLKFFRKIRQNLLTEGKTNKYYKYAFGEIILVVLGILIALSINNWNTRRLEKNNIVSYYERIIVELEAETKNAKLEKKGLDSLIDKSKRALRIMDSKNIDSLHILKHLLGATVTSWDVDYQFPITKEFINQNYLSKIENDTIKSGFETLTLLFDSSERTRNQNTSQYINTIEPFFIKNINYSEVALPLYKEALVQGGPETNYEALLTNLELWNVITFKLEALNYESGTLSQAIEFFDWIKERLKKELER